MMAYYICSISKTPSKGEVASTGRISLFWKGIFKNNPNINFLEVIGYNVIHSVIHSVIDIVCFVIYIVCFVILSITFNLENKLDYILTFLSILTFFISCMLSNCIYNRIRKKNNNPIYLAQGISYNLIFILLRLLCKYIMNENEDNRIVITILVCLLCSTKFIYDIIYWGCNKLKTYICKNKNNTLKEQEDKIIKKETNTLKEKEVKNNKQPETKPEAIDNQKDQIIKSELENNQEDQVVKTPYSLINQHKTPIACILIFLTLSAISVNY